MTTQAGAGDAGNNWHRQLFVGQIPSNWNQAELESHLAKYLKIPNGHISTEIQFDRATTLDKTPPNKTKKHTFIRFKSESYHNEALKKETFFDSDVKLNIKESNHENEKRKLFFGRLCDDITKEKITEMIGTVLPGYEEHVEDDFPQVPDQSQGKSRIAFVLFKTHQAARDVKEAFKKLSDQSVGTGKEQVSIELLRQLSHSGNIQDLVSAVDYHKRTSKDEMRQTPGSVQYEYPSGRKAIPGSRMNIVHFEAGVNENGDLEVHSELNHEGVRWPLKLTLSQSDWEKGGKYKIGQRSFVEFPTFQRSFQRNFQRSLSQPMPNMYHPHLPPPPQRPIRRNLSTTNTQRTAHQPTPTQTRSESVLHR